MSLSSLYDDKNDDDEKDDDDIDDDDYDNDEEEENNNAVATSQVNHEHVAVLGSRYRSTRDLPVVLAIQTRLAARNANFTHQRDIYRARFMMKTMMMMIMKMMMIVTLSLLLLLLLLIMIL